MTWMLTYLACALLLSAFVLLIEPHLRAEWRELALWASLLVPIAIASRPLIPASAITSIVPAPAARGHAIPLPFEPAVELFSGSHVSTFDVLAIVWIVIACMLLARDVSKHRRLLRALDRKPTGSIQVRETAARLHVHRPIAITTSSVLPVPLAIGASEVCLPAAMILMPHTDLEPILAHEVSHLRRRDPQRNMLARVISAVLWWQPLNWVIARRLRAVAELRADALTITVVTPTRLAGALVRYAQHALAPVAVGTSAFPAGLLEQRVSALLAAPKPVSPAGLRLAAFAVVATAAIPLFPRLEFALPRRPLTARVPIVYLRTIVPLASDFQAPVSAARQSAIAAPAVTARLAPSHRVEVEQGQSDVDADIVAALRELLRDPEQHVRVAARSSLRRIGSSASRDALSSDAFAATDARKDSP
jgi:bla regulator protein blaR1